MINLDSILKSRDITLPTKVCRVKAMIFPVVVHGWERWTIKKVGHQRTDVFEPWKHHGTGKDFWESLGQQGDQASQSWRKSVLNIHWKDWCWSSSTSATWCREPTHCKRPWCSKWSRVRGEGGDREWDGWMASPTEWTWVWANSGR